MYLPDPLKQQYMVNSDPPCLDYEEKGWLQSLNIAKNMSPWNSTHEFLFPWICSLLSMIVIALTCKKQIPINWWKYRFLIIAKLSMTMIQKHHLFGYSWYDNMPIYKSFLVKHVLVDCNGVFIKFLLFPFLIL